MPEQYKKETLVVVFNDEEYDDYNEIVQDTKEEEDQDTIEMRRAIYAMYDKENFERYIYWYVANYQGTMEQPYKMFDEDGELLTAYSYYNSDKNNMLEMKLVFDKEQIENTKKFLLQIGFTFDKNGVKTLDNNKLGSITKPHEIKKENEDYFAYNLYNILKSNMYEMRIVFDAMQLVNVQNMLKLGGFIVE